MSCPLTVLQWYVVPQKTVGRLQSPAIPGPSSGLVTAGAAVGSVTHLAYAAGILAAGSDGGAVAVWVVVTDSASASTTTGPQVWSGL